MFHMVIANKHKQDTHLCSSEKTNEAASLMEKVWGGGGYSLCQAYGGSKDDGFHISSFLFSTHLNTYETLYAAGVV